MPMPNKTLIDLETKFWQSMVNQDTDAALEMLSEPALMVSSHGAFKFDHAGYRKMAEQGSMIVTSFELSDMEVVFPNDTTAILTYRVKQGITPWKRQGHGAGDERLVYVDSKRQALAMRHAYGNAC